jgi:hypothetical protein
VALVRVYFGLTPTEPSSQDTARLAVAAVDDSGRLLDVCEVSDDPAGYAELGAIFAQRAGGTAGVSLAVDSDEHAVTLLLAAAGRPLAIADEDLIDDYAERFADDDSPEERHAPGPHRRAVGLARALQAGALVAHTQAAPREVANLKPVLSAHAAMANGRQAAAAALREVLREVYPAALRAYPDPADRIPLAILERLPEPGLLAVGSANHGREADVAAQLAADGLADASVLNDAVTALRVAINETPRRTGIGRSLTIAVGESVRQAIAAVRACDNAVAALVSVLDVPAPAPRPVPKPLADRSREFNRPPVPRGGQAPTPTMASATPLPPSLEMPVVRPRAVTPPPPALRPAAAADRTPLTPRRPDDRRPTTPPARSAEYPVVPPPARSAEYPVVPPPARRAPEQPLSRRGAEQPPSRRGAEQPLSRRGQEQPPARPAAAERPASRRAAEESAHPMSAPPAAHPMSAPPAAHPGSGPARPMSAPAARAVPERPVPAQPGPDRPMSAPPAASPASAPPGPRGNWPTGARDDDARPDFGTDLPDAARRVVPPWQSDDLPAEPAPLRLVEPAPIADRALRPGELKPTTPPLRLVDQNDRAGRDDLPSRARDEAPRRRRDRPEEPAAAGRGGAEPGLPQRRAGRPDGPGASALGQAFRQRGGARPEPADPSAAPVSSPPVSADGEGDGDLLIFAETRSAWFTGQFQQIDWTNPADAGWQAAEKAAQPQSNEETVAGLPKRTPRANLVPGSAQANAERSLRIVRDPAAMAAHTTGYFRGSRRGEEVRGYAVGGRPGRESAGGWDFSREPEEPSWEGTTGGRFRSAANR